MLVLYLSGYDNVFQTMRKLFCLSLSLALAMCGARAAGFTAKEDTATTKAAADSTKTDGKDAYRKLFDKKKCETVKGLVTIHKVDGEKILFELPLSVLGKDMMFGSTVAEISNNQHSVIGYKSKQPSHVKFEKANNHVNLVTVNSLYTTEQENIREAVAKSTIGGIFKSFKIEA